jgi:hypothetical protein
MADDIDLRRPLRGVVDDCPAFGDWVTTTLVAVTGASGLGFLGSP